MKQIQLLISPNGEVRLETQGFSGPACQEASRFLQQVLGQTLSEQLTSEYHQLPINLETNLPQTH